MPKSLTASIKTKRIYASPDPSDGYRLLIMRLWPRGIPKSAVDVWEKELGPSRALLDDFHKGRVSWQDYTQRYISEIHGKTELLEKVRSLISRGTVTLLCSCKDESHCHRTLLKTLLQGNQT